MRVITPIASATAALLLQACGDSDQTHSGPPEPKPLTQFTTSSHRDRDADWSPDGLWILFGSMRSGNEDIWKKPVAGGEAIQLTDSPSREDYAAWSPAGDRIAFVSNRDGGANIYTMSAEGGEWTQITQDTDQVFEQGGFGSIIDWSPDGEWIAFAKHVDGVGPSTIRHLWAVSVDGTQRRQITDGEFSDHHPNWSPDGDWIAFTSDRGEETGTDIWLVSADGSTLRQLISAPRAQTAPSWSPDGEWIAYQGWADGSQGIHIIPAEGGTPTMVTDEPDLQFFVARWSPDGQSISANSLSARTEFWGVDLDGGEMTSLQPTGLRDVGPGTFSPEGDRVAFVSRTDDGFDLFILSLEDRSYEQLTHGGIVSSDWPYVDWSPDGRVIAFIGDNDGDSQVWAAPVDGGEPMLLASMEIDVAEVSYSPDGSQLSLSVEHPDTGWDVMLMPAEGGAMVPLLATELNEFALHWSPDGSQFVFIGVDGDWYDFGIWKGSFDGVEPVRLTEGTDPDWSPDGQSISFLRGPNGLTQQLLTMPAEGGITTVLMDEGIRRFSQPVFAPSGKYILHGRTPLDQSHIWTTDVSEFVDPERQR